MNKALDFALSFTFLIAIVSLVGWGISSIPSQDEINQAHSKTHQKYFDAGREAGRLDLSPLLCPDLHYRNENSWKKGFIQGQLDLKEKQGKTAQNDE